MSITTVGLLLQGGIRPFLYIGCTSPQILDCARLFLGQVSVRLGQGISWVRICLKVLRWRELLSTRQRKILNLIVADYIRTAIPVSSEAIARRREIDVSSATVRNDVAVLEDAQYITRPHASAGSVPTDQGYRLHVGPVLSGSGGDLPVPVRRRVERRLIEVERELDEWARVAADILSSIAGNMAIATFPRPRVSRVTHVEMIPIQGFLGMMIVVLEQARLRRQVIQLEEPVEQLDLYNSMNRVKRHVMGLTRHEIEAIKADLTPLEESMVEETILILKEEEQRALLSHNVDGLLNLLRQPEFENNGTLRSLIEKIEDGSLVKAVLDQSPGRDGVVRVIIGGENRDDMLQPLSVVIGGYGNVQQFVGSVCAIGPTRMEYARAIEGVRFISSIMSEMVGRVHNT